MFEEMFRNNLAMYIYIGLMILLGLSMMGVGIWSSGLFDGIREKISEKRIKNNDMWSFNPFILLFGGVAIFVFIIFDNLKNWFIKYKYKIIWWGINIAMILPMMLSVTGVIEKLPNFYFPLFVFYFFIIMIALMARVDNKRNGYYYHNQNSDRYDYGYQPSRQTYIKPKLRGLSKDQINKRKKKIRDTLLENEELKKKYSL